jgi:23S rRNA (pseudouridine1915-N3)-methyltransferase
MKYTILAVGRIRPPFADDLEHYRRMLSGRARLELIELRDEQSPSATGEHVERRIPPRSHRVLLDVEGKAYDSVAFARWLEARRQAGRDVCFVVGGPYGVRLERCDEKLSFGPMTFPHQLARVMLIEQLYRAHKILAGEPYHH